MLARIQQLIAAILLGLTLTFFVIGVHAHSPWLGPSWLAIVVMGYVGVLAIEFAWLLGSYEASDPVRPRSRQLLRAWVGEVTVAPRVFGWRQPFRSHSEPDHLGNAPQGRRGLLLVHGFFCNRGLWNPWLRRLRAGGIPFVAVNLQPVLGAIDDYRQTIDDGVQRLREATGLAPVIVAHSMGGLAVRAWLAAGDAARAHRVITIASPHAGTRLGLHGRGLNVAQMRPGDPWLEHLAASEDRQGRERFVCFWSHCDNIVFPTRNATLPGADNRHLDVTPHVAMVYHPEVMAAAWAALGADLCETEVRRTRP